jgi:hypothetical protein
VNEKSENVGFLQMKELMQSINSNLVTSYMPGDHVLLKNGDVLKIHSVDDLNNKLGVVPSIGRSFFTREEVKVIDFYDVDRNISTDLQNYDFLKSSNNS